jgi:hypothetical protein
MTGGVTMRAAILVGALAMMAGCTGMEAGTPRPAGASATAPRTGTCAAEPAQIRVGQTATADIGAELLRLSGAQTLRWVAPHMAVTMDYRFDRLTVTYDAGMTIVGITCG